MEENVHDMVSLVTSLGLPTALVLILMWYQYKRDEKADDKQKQIETLAIAREQRLAGRVTELEGMINTELLAIAKSSAELQTKIVGVMEELADRVKENTESTRELHSRMGLRPCLLECERRQLLDDVRDLRERPPRDP